MTVLVPLICIRAASIVEPYYADRVLRQFSWVQTIPSCPIAADVPGRGEKKNKDVMLALVQYLRVWDSHILSDKHLGRVARPPSECDPRYLNWYLTYSHSIVQNPDNRSSYVRKSGPHTR